MIHLGYYNLYCYTHKTMWWPRLCRVAICFRSYNVSSIPPIWIWGWSPVCILDNWTAAHGTLGIWDLGSECWWILCENDGSHSRGKRICRARSRTTAQLNARHGGNRMWSQLTESEKFSWGCWYGRITCRHDNTFHLKLKATGSIIRFLPEVESDPWHHCDLLTRNGYVMLDTHFNSCSRWGQARAVR